MSGGIHCHGQTACEIYERIKETADGRTRHEWYIWPVRGGSLHAIGAVRVPALYGQSLAAAVAGGAKKRRRRDAAAPGGVRGRDDARAGARRD